MGTVVIDASPLVTLMSDEPRASIVQSHLEVHASSAELTISSVNWCEVLYAVRRKKGMDVAADAARWIRRVPIRVVDATEELAGLAAELKFRYRLSLGDAFAAGLALATDSPLLTGDVDFLPLVERGLRLDWVGPERA